MGWQQKQEKTEPCIEEQQSELANPPKSKLSHMEVSNDEKLGMSKYANFIKEIQSKYVRRNEQETVMLTMALLKKVPTEGEDPKRFYIPCTIASSYFYNLYTI